MERIEYLPNVTLEPYVKTRLIRVVGLIYRVED